MKLQRVLFLALVFVLLMATTAPAYAETQPYKCVFLKQTPLDYTIMSPNQHFTMVWTLKNSGTQAWKGIYLVYLGGTHMEQFSPVIHLMQTVAHGQLLSAKVPMIAPAAKGAYYEADWGLAVGTTVFCKFYVVISVK